MSTSPEPSAATGSHRLGDLGPTEPSDASAWHPDPVSGFTDANYRIPADPLGFLRRRLAREERPVATIRRLFLEHTYGRLSARERFRVNLFWYRTVVGANSRREMGRHGEHVERTHGIPLSRQRRDMIRLACTATMSPKSYYRYQLYLPERKEWQHELLLRYQLKGFVYDFLHQGLDVRGRAPVTDKLAFAMRCQETGLPHIPVHAVFTDGEVSWLSEPTDSDLFAKPLAWKGGSGAAAWLFRSKDSTYRLLGKKRRCSLSELTDRYREASKDRPYILGPRVTNHPALADIALDTLSTVRATTILDEEGVPQVVAAVLRMPSRSGTAVDNGHRGGIMAPIDIGTGRLGSATTLDPARFGRVSKHPLTGARIEGLRLPMWEDVVRLSQEALRVFHPRVIVGWDVAITADGPVLVEGNSKPDLEIMQVAHGPLGHGRLGQLLAWHLQRRDARWRGEQGLRPSTQALRESKG